MMIMVRESLKKNMTNSESYISYPVGYKLIHLTLQKRYLTSLTEKGFVQISY